MNNQHKHIKGYRELTTEEIELMNVIKTIGADLDETIKFIEVFLEKDNEVHGSPDAESRRWLNIGKTHLQQGLMAITRAIARPTFF
jgi:hypothetical protein